MLFFAICVPVLVFIGTIASTPIKIPEINEAVKYATFIFLSTILSSLIIFLEPKVFFIFWSFFSSFGIALCYIIAKKMSGGGNKLEQKESSLGRIFTQQTAIETE